MSDITIPGSAAALAFTDGAQVLGTKAASDGQVLTYDSGTGTWRAEAAASSGIGGSSGAVDNAVIRADGTGGATVQSSAVTIDDSGNLSTSGTVTGSNISRAGQVAALSASGITAGSTYEVTGPTEPGGTGLLQMKRVGNFPTSRTIFAADSEFGWTWANRTTWGGTGNDNTTNAGYSTWNFTTTSVLWFGGTYTAPYRYRTIQVEANDVLEVITRVASNGQRNYELAGIQIQNAASSAQYSRVLMGYDSGLTGTNIGVRAADSNNLNGGVALTSTNRDNGVWLKLRWSCFGVQYQYNTSTSSTPPTSGWISFGISGLSGTPTWGLNNSRTSVRVGMIAQNENTSGGFVVKFGWFSMTLNGSPFSAEPWQWGTELFSTGASEQLIGEVDFGAAVSLDQTKLRQFCTDVVNTRSWDTATVTFSVVGSASTGPASGTYYAAGSIVVSGSYRYWRVYAKILSDGTTQGSIGAPIFLPVSA